MRIYNKMLPIIIITLSLLLLHDSGELRAQSIDSEIQNLKEEIQKMRNESLRLERRVEQLEKKKSLQKEEIQKLTKEVKEREYRETDTESIMSWTQRYVDRRIQRFGVYPTSKLFISGYGDAQFIAPENGNSTFSARFAPIFHYQLSDRVHFIVEPEISLVDDETEIALEVGEIDFILNDHLTLVAGKFLLPFNVFSERLHPTWINKMPDTPLIYGHGHGDEDTAGIIPVMSDVGFQLRGGAALPLFTGSKIMYAAYVTNGPRADIHDGETSIEFGQNFTDNNSNKAVGGRVGILPIWNMEFGASFMYGEANDDTDVLLLGFDGEYHYRGLELRGEFVHLENDERVGDDWEVAETNGLYLQGAYRLSQLSVGNQVMQTHVQRLEPVIRYGEIFHENDDDISQIAFGLNYWIRPSYALKLAYQFNDGINNKFLVQLAFGF